MTSGYIFYFYFLNTASCLFFFFCHAIYNPYRLVAVVQTYRFFQSPMKLKKKKKRLNGLAWEFLQFKTEKVLDINL